MSKTICCTVWLFTATIMFFAVGVPLGIEAQLVIALMALAAMSVIRVFRLRGMFRTIFLGLGLFVILRYVVWRVTSTMPSFDTPLDFLAGAILLAAELYCVVMMCLSLFTVADPIDRKDPPIPEPDHAPNIDIFVPSYNESTEILAATLAAAKRIIYFEGKINVFLLDDGGTDQKINAADPVKAAAARLRRSSLQQLCADLDCKYLARQVNSNAKAGNLNNGLAHSSGELVVILDADHAPSREFLMKTVGYFQDPKLFLVQTPHFFLNVDPIEKNLGLRGMPSETEMFYNTVQKGLDKWNAAFFCGSAAVLRRSALDEVQGFHGSSITEDAETALELHSRGWKSIYVDRPMIAGLQPETFESFIVQRSRWCRGMIQILLLKNPLFKRGLSVAQRLCYLSSAMFWLFPLPRMIFMFTPMFYIFFNMKIYIANQQEFMAYTAAHLTAAAMIQNYVFGRVRWPWTSDVYEYVQSVQLVRALISVFVNPHRPKFEVTAKGLTLDEARLTSLAKPYFVIFLMVLASFSVLVYRYTQEVGARDLLTVIGIWTLLNLGISGIALGAVAERRERRGLPRMNIASEATLTFEDRSFDITITDMSFGGLRIRFHAAPGEMEHKAGLLCLPVPGKPNEHWETEVVLTARETTADFTGARLAFVGSGADRYRIVACVMFSNVFHEYQNRRKGFRTIGILWASTLLTVWSLVQIIRGIFFAVLHCGRSIAHVGRMPARPSQTAIASDATSDMRPGVQALRSDLVVSRDAHGQARLLRHFLKLAKLGHSGQTSFDRADEGSRGRIVELQQPNPIKPNTILEAS